MVINGVAWVAFYAGAVVAYARITERMARDKLEATKHMMENLEIDDDTDIGRARVESVKNMRATLSALGEPFRNEIANCTNILMALIVVQTILSVLSYLSLDIVLFSKPEWFTSEWIKEGEEILLSGTIAAVAVICSAFFLFRISLRTRGHENEIVQAISGAQSKVVGRHVQDLFGAHLKDFPKD